MTHDLSTQLIDLAKTVQAAIIEQCTQEDGTAIPGSGADQVRMLDGGDVVIDYVAQQEFGLAFEHLAYMVSESGAEFTPETMMAFAAVAKSIT